MLKKTIMPQFTMQKLKIIGLCTLLLLILALSLLACANPTLTPSPNIVSNPISAPPSTPTTPSAPATFELADLRVNPAEINPGDGVIITVKVTNTGSVDGIYNAELRVNGVAEVLTKITVPAETTKTSSFFVSKDIPGTYDVALDGLIGEFVVTNPDSVTPLENCHTDTPPKSNIPGCCGK